MYRERMNSYYPQVIQSILEFKAIIDGEYPEFESLDEAKESALNDAYLLTMSESRILEWEKILGINPIDGSTLSDRRETIIARIRGQGKLNTNLINAIVKTFTGGTAESWIEDSILYVAITPPPGNKQYQFANVEQEIGMKVPAHLGFEISRNYFTWNEIKNEYGTWGAVNAAFDTWEDVLLFVPFTSKIVDVSGVVIKIADSIVAPLQGMNVYGQTTQDGTPTPDAPVELVSVENPDVTVVGKNFVPYPHYDTTKTMHNITFTDNGDGTITANGTATGDANYACVALAYNTIPIKAGKYTISGCPSGGGALTYELAVGYRETQDGIRQLNFERGNGLTVEWLEDGYIDVICVVRNGVTANNLVFHPQIELGDAVTDFESYIEPQSLAVPYTLHGIPVTEGGNYTDANGQQWITDEIDFERGVYIQRTKLVNLSDSDGWNTWGVDYQTEGNTGFYKSDSDISGGVIPVLCSIVPFNSRTWGGTEVGAFTTATGSLYYAVTVSNANLEDVSSNEAALASFINLAQETDAKILISRTPMEISLTEDELTAYAALYTNNPNTIIFNDANAPMAVKYKQVDKRS